MNENANTTDNANIFPNARRLDALSVRALAREMRQHFAGAKVQKVVQYGPVEFALHLWKPNPERDFILEHQWLSLHLNKQNPFVVMLPAETLRAIYPEQERAQSPLLMLLRKYLLGARLDTISHEPGEPLLRLDFNTSTELGFRAAVSLVVECMGKYSNLLLLEGETQKVLGLLNVVDEEQSRLRPLHTGAAYAPPPRPAHKTPLETLNIAQVLREGFAEHTPYTPALALKQLQSHGWGVSKQQLLPVLEAANSLEAAIAELETLIDSPAPFLPEDKREASSAPTLLALADYYGNWKRRQVLHHQQVRLRAPLRHKMRFVQQGLEKLEVARVSEATLAEWRAIGDALMTLQSMGYFETPQPTRAEIQLADNPLGLPIPETVELDTQKSWLENARAYYRKHQKGRGRNQYSKAEIERLAGELEALEMLNVLLESVESAEDLALLEDDWVAHGLLSPAKPKGRKAQKGKPGQADETQGILKVESADGLMVLVGKSARANGQLVSKHLKPNDWWVHAGEGIPGSHVIIKTQGSPHAEGALPLATLELAAGLAAWFSAGRESAKVPVVYTRGRYVRSIPNSWPGHVTHTHEEALMMPPQAPPTQ